ncbi:MAG: SDR family oxidoreductase [Silicimonas sp.]|nr:SDR family oxidoreductase [Silicimonas sp.]
MTNAIFPDLKDASVFVTGGASGIGAALVQGFAAQGARVAFADIQDKATTDTADAVAKATGTRPLGLLADVTDVAALRSAIDTAADAHGPITVLVNNAAWDVRKGALDVDEAYWDKMQSRNLKHQFFAAQAVVPGMQRAGGGRIVNFSSISYMMGMGDYPAYTAAKAGITALTRSFAREFGRDNIRVNAVMPGWVLTPRQMELWATPESLDAVQARMCLADHLKPVDMVGPVMFLASEASTVITGQAIVVDGGVVVTG